MISFHFQGVDFSAAEAFVRIQRLLEDKQVVLVMCGCPADSSVGLALRSVDLWAGGASTNQVEVFENLNDALEVKFDSLLHSARPCTDQVIFRIRSIAKMPISEVYIRNPSIHLILVLLYLLK